MTRFVSTRNIRFLITEVFDASALTAHPYYDR
ncbi:MAG: acyl-CoA dehydrogenase N-terminal domain-containing protein, partial [Desulfotignum sp.]